MAEGHFQRFINVVAYLQFCTKELVIPREYHMYEVHVVKVNNTKEKYIILPYFKNDITHILGALRNGKETIYPLNDIPTPNIWNVYDGFRGVYSR